MHAHFPVLTRSLLAGLMLLALRAPAVDAPADVAHATRAPAAIAAAGAGTAAGSTAPAAASPAAAQASAPQLPVDEILRRNLEARGGAAAWKKVNALAFSGRMDAGRKHPEVDNSYANPNASLKDRRKSRILRERELDNAQAIELPYTLTLARGRKSRLEVVFQDKTAVQVYDGANGWKLRPWLAPDRQLQPYSSEEQKLAADQSDLDGWLIDAKAKGNTVQEEGVDAVDGKAAYRLKVSLPNGDVRHVWVDAQSFLDVKVESARRMDGKIKPMYTAQRDFRTVDGVKLPFLMETSMDGVRYADRLVIEKAAVNPVVDGSAFVRPSAPKTAAVAGAAGARP